MKRAIRRALTVALLLNLSFLSAAESAKSLYNKGKIAEARQNYEQAYDLYKQAYDQKPQDVSYRAAYERLRFLAGASHVHRGQLLREAGRLEEALAEFQKATDIDPASAIAASAGFGWCGAVAPTPCRGVCHVQEQARAVKKAALRLQKTIQGRRHS